MKTENNIHFEISERKVLLRLFDLLFVGLFLYLVNQFFTFDYFLINETHWVWLFILGLYISVFGTVFEIYDLQKSSKVSSIIPAVILTTSVTVLVYLLTPFFTPILPDNRLQILFFYCSILVALLVWRFAYIYLISTPRFYKKVLIVGEGAHIKNIYKTLGKADPNYKIIGFVNTDGSNVISNKYFEEYNTDNFHEVLKRKSVSEIIVAAQNSDTITPQLYNNLLELLESGFPIREYTSVYEEMMERIPVNYVGKDFYKYFPFSRNNSNKLYLTSRRVLDLILALVGTLALIIVFPLVVIGNFLWSKGPLLYSQKRVGINEKTFIIYKFRSMVINAESNGAVWAAKNDARITKFGHFMRKTRIDELPQIINIIRGDMSFIGPRPERPEFVSKLSETIPFYKTRHIVKPGLTGWAQVKARYGNSEEDSLIKLQYDLYYIKHRGFVLDTNILMKTLSTVIFFRGQ